MPGPVAQMPVLSPTYDISDRLKFETRTTNIANRPGCTSSDALSHGEPGGFSIDFQHKH